MYHLLYNKETYIYLLFFFFGKIDTETEKAMPPHSSTLAWKIAWTNEPGRLQSMRSLRVRYELEEEMATHSIVLAWRISGTAEPGGLPSMGSHRVGHD